VLYFSNTNCGGLFYGSGRQCCRAGAAKQGLALPSSVHGPPLLPFSYPARAPPAAFGHSARAKGSREAAVEWNRSNVVKNLPCHSADGEKDIELIGPSDRCYENFVP